MPWIQTGDSLCLPGEVSLGQQGCCCLRENSAAGDVQSLQEGDFASPGMHRQVIHLSLLLGSLQLLYLKTWVGFF